MNIKRICYLTVFSCLLVFSSCEKKPKPAEEDEQPQNTNVLKSLNAVKEFAMISQQFSATVKECGDNVDASISGKKQFAKSGENPNIDVEFRNGKWYLKCDYGDTFMRCQDGFWRKGIVNIETTGQFVNIGTVMIMTFDNFYQKESLLALQYHKLEGTQRIENIGTNGSMINFTCKVENGIITFFSTTNDSDTGKSVQYTEETVKNWERGTEICSNHFYITGEWNGVSSDNVHYTLNANEDQPLHYKVCCNFFQSGVLNVTVDGLIPFTITYGDETNDTNECNKKAVLYYPSLVPITIPINI